ncbi:MAG: transcriptional regulator MarR family [Frankiales bacterium]|nr:transcriptional regulator MarR family [Frankiales bacterium]
MDAEREDSLEESFWNVAGRLRRLSRQTLAPWNISPSHSRAVGVLLRHGEMRLNELSEHLRIAARSTTEVVDALQEHGLVARRPDPADRRATLVALTEHGRQVATAIRTARSEQGRQFFEVLSAADRAELARILQRLGA